MASSSDTPRPAWLRDRCSGILAAGIVLALLYVGRSVLIPLTLALMLSLLVAPLVRALRRIGAGQTSSVLLAVLALAVSFAAVAAALGMQVLRAAESLPQYEANVQHKLRALDEVTVGRLGALTGEASRLIGMPDAPEAVAVPTSAREQAGPILRMGLEALAPPGVSPQPLRLIRKVLASAWVPLQATGIVLLVLVFVLLEHESLRDRFIRIAGATDIRAATLALNDAGERLSRFFVSQFAVNVGFGVCIWLSLSLLRVPQAMLLGALAGVMRFAPYVGVWIAGLFSTALAFAVDPGWSLALATLAIFVLLDIIAGQLLEPHLYGHATGLSPLAIVVAAIFWSSLWGPVGLVLSTPLTLCLVVAGRHVKALGALELLLSDAQALTLPQRFYQRALSADPHEIVANARTFLKRHSLAAYCDRVLIPALHLARLDTDRGATSEEQHVKIRRVIFDVAAALTTSSHKLPRRGPRGSVLEDVSAGRWLRQQREQASGRWQGPLGVPPGSVVICLGLGSSADDLATELLVRLLRAQKIDARHFSPADTGDGLPPGADPDGTSIVYLMSAFPGPERERADSISKQIRKLFPQAYLVRVFCPGVAVLPEVGESAGNADQTANSLVQAIQICAGLREAHGSEPAAPPPPAVVHQPHFKQVATATA
jgi:predicted PurR-regulated permease PerM